MPARDGPQAADDLAAHLTELFLPAGMEEAQARVVQPEQVQQGHVQVAQGVNHVDGATADLVRGADDLA